jgi:hypothetical protein
MSEISDKAIVYKQIPCIFYKSLQYKVAIINLFRSKINCDAFFREFLLFSHKNLFLPQFMTLSLPAKMNSFILLGCLKNL